MPDISGVQCSVTFDLTMDALTDILERSVEEIIELWDTDTLADLLNNIDLADIIGYAESDYGGIEVVCGRM